MTQEQIEVQEYFLKPGYIFIYQGPAIIRTVLGSAVSVALWDRQHQLGGINHYIYPRTGNRHEATARYGNVAMLTLINLLLEEGANLENLEAQIFGGASRSVAPDDAGEQNIQIARQILAKKNIPVVSEDVGGFKGRKLMYNLATNEAVILKVERIRESDWYPYQNRS
ncbi:MAG: hypothetical protein BZ151_08475 [Desulfobacca sp. 4484_104]|nr:MAG: hypothetical protein BZ151_08475 [Desulfobacca sp. 4484_104]RLA89976.1 MAG: hypothetical protein DRG58_03630 [Deltaproteobacteria bacterium]